MGYQWAGKTKSNVSMYDIPKHLTVEAKQSKIRHLLKLKGITEKAVTTSSHPSQRSTERSRIEPIKPDLNKVRTNREEIKTWRKQKVIKYFILIFSNSLNYLHFLN